MFYFEDPVTHQTTTIPIKKIDLYFSNLNLFCFVLFFPRKFKISVFP